MIIFSCKFLFIISIGTGLGIYRNLRWKYKDGVGVVYASPPILQFHGCTFEEFHELWSERVHPDDVEEMVATLAKAVATKTVVRTRLNQ